jgi:osmotically-inducible protein OsmY
MNRSPAPKRVADGLALAGLLLASAFALQGCIETLILGGAATGVALAVDRRQPEVVLGDNRIEIVAGSRVGDALHDQGHVNITCYNYMVLITGEVPTQEDKARVEKIVAEVPQVKTVVNELQIAGATSVGSRSNDAYITSKVKSNLLAADKVKPTQVKVVTENGVVYLLGLVTREEADSATETARSTGGVQKVVRVFEYITPPPPEPVAPGPAKK